jgi:hypothetical protein
MVTRFVVLIVLGAVTGAIGFVMNRKAFGDVPYVEDELLTTM